MGQRDERVSVVFTKWGGLPHWHFECRRVGEDEFGVWLAGAPGTPLQRADEAPVVLGHGFVQLVPHQGEWMAAFNRDGWCELYVDAPRPRSGRAAPSRASTSTWT